jgi:DeoR/GlpR family transcriptional regulator of sugar metabolism
MLERSERACLLADHSKAGQRQFAVVCTTSELDVLVTGRPLDAKLAAALASANVTVQLAPEDTVGAAA